MRKTIERNSGWWLPLLVLGFCGCDEIEDPVIPVTTNYLEAAYGPAPVFDALSQTQAVKRVLVEDFTAHRCGNCPAAAIIAEGIAENYDGLVSVMAIHAGNLANTDDSYFDTDWTTEEGDVYWDQLDFQAYPVGRVNRINGVGSFLGSRAMGGEGYGRARIDSLPRIAACVRVGSCE